MAVRTLILSCACLMATPCLAQQTAPSAEQGAKARADLQSIFQPEGSFGSGGGLDEGVMSSRIYTRPHATDYPGLCRRYSVSVGYARFGPRGYGDPGDPFSIAAQAQYRVIADRVAIPGYRPHAYLPFEGSCASIDAKGEAGWLTTDDPLGSGAVAFGYNDLMIAVATIREGRKRIPGCHGRDGKVSDACRSFASGNFPGDISSIDRCASKTPDACYCIGMTDGTTILIYLAYRGVGRDEALQSIDIQVDNDIVVGGRRGD